LCGTTVGWLREYDRGIAGGFSDLLSAGVLREKIGSPLQRASMTTKLQEKAQDAI